MDNFLYIIIGIVWVVYSLYTSKQKQQKKREMDAQRKNQPLPGPGPQKPRSLLEQLLDPEHKFTDPATVAYEEDEYEDTVEPILSEYKEEHSYMSEYQPLETIKNEVSADYFENQYLSRGETNYYDKMETLVAAHDEVIQTEDLVVDFDLRKAIIFSEILNPKYI